MKLSYLVSLLVAVSANVAANVCLRFLARDNGLNAPGESLWEKLWLLLTSPWSWLALVFAGTLLVAYTYSLKGLPLFVAYPSVTGLAMLGVGFTSWALFGEAMDSRSVLGMAMILGGVSLLSASTG